MIHAYLRRRSKNIRSWRDNGNDGHKQLTSGEMMMRKKEKEKKRRRKSRAIEREREKEGPTKK
jgi:hypothetical protein